jgi:hypothetical protein
MTSKSAALLFFCKSNSASQRFSTKRIRIAHLRAVNQQGDTSQERNPIPGTPVATSSDGGDKSFSVSRVEVRLFLWAGKNSFVWIQQELAGARRCRQVK